MGKYENGILGYFNGKVGSIIGSRWKGIRYMRAKPGPRSGNFSAKQLEQQARFGLCIRFIQPLHPVLKIGYRSQARKSTAVNTALGDLIREAVVGDYPDYGINYAAIRIAKGTLLPASNPTVVEEGGRIRFNWAFEASQAGCSADDGALMVAMSETGEATFSLLQVQRSAQTALMSFPLVAAGSRIHCYLAMVSASTKEASNSVYLGVLKMTV